MQNSLPSAMPGLGSIRPANAMPEFDWADILRLWRRGAIYIAVAGLLGAVVFYALSFTIPPTYDTSTVLLIDRPDASRIADSTNTFQTDAAQRGIMVRSQIEVLRGQDIVGRVIDKLDLAHAPGFQERSGLLHNLLAPLQVFVGKLVPKHVSAPQTAMSRRTELIQRYLSSLSVQQDLDTYIIRLSFTAPDPELAARILNTHVAEYFDWLQTQRRTAVFDAYGWLQQAVPNAEQRVLATQAAVERFRTQHNLVDIDGHTSLDQGLAQVSTDLATAETTLVHARARADQIRALQLAGRINGIIALSDSKLLPDLEASAVAAGAELASLESAHGPDYPTVRSARAHLNEVRASINAEIDHLVQGERSTAEIAAATVTSLKAALSDSKQDKLGAENAGAELSRLESVAQAEQNVYISLLTRLRSFDHVGDLQTSQATLLSQALIPEVPSSPKRTLFAIFGLFALSGLAATTIVWRAGRRGVVRHTADLLLSSGVQQIAVMPEMALDHRLGGFNRAHPTYVFFQQELRMLYALLLRKAGHLGRGIAVTVTSALPDEGKTSFCGELALFASQSGIRTLLVTTDPKARISKVPAVLDLPQTDPLRPLSWVALPITGNLARHGAAAKTIADWQRDYDLVIIDTPPVSFMADSVVLASAVDAVLVLARCDRTPYPLLSAVVNQLENAGGNVVGAILTFAKLEQQRGVLPSDASYYFSSNRSYYRQLRAAKLLEGTETQTG